ncbi:hypothetical protein ODS41_05605 [Pyrobaculum sp. 3827-6]|uniref:hypothetical protein n=1 Tax=Pyrobaculum sp. 3827-6 TaxID=2983604 RepID=UPI0021DB5187|nr:hypothetical protein [Pyrobaculum sp. 3827-6]MCU7787393.1 hypothetical protein [Pyrobaculum sp. 3827-6]
MAQKLQVKLAALAAFAAVAVVVALSAGAFKAAPYYQSRDGRVAAYLVQSSGGTNLVLEVVDVNGRPVNFTAFLSGPVVDKFRDVGVVKGKGRGKAAIGGYVAEAAQLARKLGYKPDEVRFGVVAFITAVEKQENETYLLTDIVTIPVGPGEAVGKDIVAKVRFEPRFKIKIGTGRPPDAAGDVAQASNAQNTPPDTIDMGCDSPVGYATCYRYRAVETYASSAEGVPLLVTRTDSFDSKYILQIIHDHNIFLSTQTITSISFEMSFAVFKKSVNNNNDFEVQALGPGFEIVLSQQTEKKLLELSCRFAPGQSTECYYGRSGFTPVNSYYAGDSILATGLVGDVRAVKYILEERWCYIFPSGAVYCGEWRPTDVEAWGVWLAGLWGGDSFLPYAEVSNNPYSRDDKLGYLYQSTLDLYRLGKVNVRWLESYYTDYYKVSWSTLAWSSQSSSYFSVGVPAGAIVNWVILKRFGVVLPSHISKALDSLSVGVSVGTSRLDILSYYASVHMSAKTAVKWSPFYYEFTNYYIKMADQYYNVPVAIVRPFIIG